MRPQFIINPCFPDVQEELFQGIGGSGALPSCLTIVTGPSKTADIEGVLITGVHGPGRVDILLLEGC